MRYDSIVIGSGLSGLTSALLLARSGRRVLVLEQHPKPAPVVSGFFREGIYYDSGFHYVGGLGEGGAFRPLFHHLGLENKLNLFPYAKQGFDRLRISASGEDFCLPVGFSNIKRELGKQFSAVKSGIDRYLDEIEKNWSYSPYLDLEADFHEFSSGSIHGQSLATRLLEFSAYPELQGLLSMHSMLYGVDPAEALTTFNTQVVGSYYHSVYGISGGGKALVKALLELLTVAGGEVRCREEVTGLLIKSGAISGVLLAGGEEISTREVVATLNPTLLPGLLPERVLRPVYLKRLKSLRQTSSAYIFFGKSTRPVEILNRCNLFVQPQKGTFDLGEGLPLKSRSFYLAGMDQDETAYQNRVIGIVPANYAEVAEYHVGKKRRSSAYQRKKQQIGDQLQMMFVDNCPELENLELLELATPLTLHDYPLSPNGAIYGVGRFIDQYNPHPVTRLPGLFLSGQAIAGPGLLGTMISAYLTCGSMLGHDLLRGEIKAWR